MSKPPHSQRGQPADRPPVPQQTATRSVLTTASAWSGPLPAPADLEKFNAIIPNGADRILAMAEAEQAHRIAYEASGLQAATKEASRGQYLGAAISLAALCGAVYAAYIGTHWSVSVALVGIPVLGMIRAIVRPRPPPSKQ